MNLHQWRLFKFAVREDHFNVFDVLLKQEAKYQFQIEQCYSYYLAGSGAKYCNSVTLAVFLEDLNKDSASLNDAEFKDKYRMTQRSSFWLIVDKIKDHRVFESKKRNDKMDSLAQAYWWFTREAPPCSSMLVYGKE
jgi:hypothetical protein